MHLLKKKPRKYMLNQGMVCSVSGCERAARIKGMCRMHYQQKNYSKWRKTK